MTPTLRELPSLAPYAAEWDELVAAMALPSPFLRSWWLTSVDDGNGTYVLVFDDDKLIGGLPLTKRKLAGVELYRFVGYGTLCPDHLDVVAAPEQLQTVTDALASWARQRGNRLFDLAGIAEQSRLPAWLPHARVDTRESAPCAQLPTSFDDYLGSRPKSFRKTWRRAQNRFDRLGTSVRFADSASIDAALAEFERMHRERGDRDALLAELPRLTTALRAGAAAGEAWIDVLAAHDKTLGVAISFAVCGRLSLYQNARITDRAADNAGTALGLASVERAIGLGFTEVDLLRGEEPYKFEWGEQVRTMARVRAAHGLLALAALYAIEFARRAARLLRALSRARRASAAESDS